MVTLTEKEKEEEYISEISDILRRMEENDWFTKFNAIESLKAISPYIPKEKIIPIIKALSKSAADKNLNVRLSAYMALKYIISYKKLDFNNLSNFMEPYISREKIDQLVEALKISKAIQDQIETIRELSTIPPIFNKIISSIKKS